MTDMKPEINYRTLPAISSADSLLNQISWNKNEAEMTVAASEDQFGCLPKDRGNYLRWGQFNHNRLIESIEKNRSVLWLYRF